MAGIPSVSAVSIDKLKAVWIQQCTRQFRSSTLLAGCLDCQRACEIARHREVDEVQEREKDASGNVYMTIAELKQQEAKRRAGTPIATMQTICRSHDTREVLAGIGFISAHAGDHLGNSQHLRFPGHWCLTSLHVAAAVRTGQAVEVEVAAAAKPSAAASPTEEDDDDDDGGRAMWSLERRTAEQLVEELVVQWQAPMDALANAGKAFEGLEALLGGASGGSFDLKVRLPNRESARCQELPEGANTAVAQIVPWECAEQHFDRAPAWQSSSVALQCHRKHPRELPLFALYERCSITSISREDLMYKVRCLPDPLTPCCSGQPVET